MYGFTLLLLLALLCEYVSSTPSNVTIDDLNGDPATGAVPVYAPASAWTQGNQCTTCSAQPDASQAFDGTWHDSTAGHAPGSTDTPYTVSITFKGTAIYVFCILANQIQYVTTTTFLSFTIDGNSVGPSFTHNPDNTEDYIYNALVFSNEGLSDANHNLIVSSEVTNGQNSLLLFDYAIYTTDPNSDPSPVVSSSPPNSPPPISATSTAPEKSSTSSTGRSSTPGLITSSDGATTPSVSSPSSSHTSSSGMSAQSHSTDDSTTSNAPTSSGSQSPPTSSSITIVSRPPANHISAIIGGVVGGVAGAVVFGLLAWLCKRRHHKYQLRVKPTDVVLTRETPGWISSKRPRERASLLTTISPGFGSSAEFLAMDNPAARRHDELIHQVRVLEEQNHEVDLGNGEVLPPTSQVYETLDETEVLRRQVRNLLVNMQDLRAQQRELEGHIAPPMYGDHMRPSID